MKGLAKQLDLNLLMNNQTVFGRQKYDRHLLHFFYPHLIYSIEFWGYASKTYSKPIKVLQKSALRLIVKACLILFWKTEDYASNHAP